MSSSLPLQAPAAAPTPRLDLPEFTAQAPAAYAALVALSKAAADSGLERSLMELVKVRASQLNGCAFCLQFHLNLARQAGVAGLKLDLVSVWREAGVHTAREMAALAWAEALTINPAAGASDAAYAAMRAEFDATESLFLTITIGTINQWNRIAVALRFRPPVPEAARAPAAS